jgi:hypothetical protein
VKHIILLLAVVCAVASFVFPYAAKAAASGSTGLLRCARRLAKHVTGPFVVAAILPNEKPRLDRMVGAK